MSSNLIALICFILLSIFLICFFIMNSLLHIISPLDQFEIRDLISLNAPILGNLSLSLTNIGLYLTLAGYLVFVLSLIGNNNERIVSNSWSICQETIYATVHSIVVNQINEKRGQIYFPFIYVLFVFILINNLIGMIPYSFASTSHFYFNFFIKFYSCTRCYYFRIK